MPTRPSIAGPATATFVAIALCGIVPALLYGATDRRGAPDALLLIVVMVVVGARFAFLVGGNTRQPYQMIFYLFAYIFMGMAPYVQLRLNVWPSNTPFIDARFLEPAALVVVAGIVAYFVGSTVLKSKGIGVKPVGLVSPRRSVLLGVGALAFFGFYALSIGPQNLFIARNDLSALRAGQWSSTVGVVITAVAQMSLLVAYVGLRRLKLQIAETAIKDPAFLRFAVLVALLVAVNPISTPRYVFGTALLGIFAAHGAFATPGRFRTMSVASIVGMITLFPLADLFRRRVDAQLSFQDPVTTLTTGDFDSFAQVANALDYVSDAGIAVGRQMLGVILFWVPSDFWPDKPIDTGTMLADHMGYAYGNLSAPIWAEFYVNGGWFALIVGMFALGMWMKRMDIGTEAAMASAPVPSVTACILPFYMLILLRGSLLSAVSYLAVVLLCAWFIRYRASDEPSARRVTKAPSHAYRHMVARQSEPLR